MAPRDKGRYAARAIRRWSEFLDAWVETKALEVLRLMVTRQAERREGAYVIPVNVAEEAELDSRSSGFDRVVDYLESEGAIVLDERFDAVVGADIYTLTRRGLEMAQEP